ncbi:MAG TPA: response regulator transcription factor [Fibrobacteria bacterium]|nr:response regulator transcription factor [Fibrobacteria bacterium]
MPEPGTKARIYLVDDHPLVLSGLANLIREQPDMSVVGEADDAQKAMEGFKATSPDIALVDISLKGMDGLELIKHAKARFPSLAILVLSMHDESLYAERAIRAGAGGYIMKQEAAEKVVVAVRRILDGETYLSDKMYSHLARRMAGGAERGGISPLRQLSDRELEIFNLMGNGRRIKEIAENLGISTKTVETHCAHLRKKLNLKGSVELMQFAIRWHHSRQS